MSLSRRNFTGLSSRSCIALPNLHREFGTHPGGDSDAGALLVCVFLYVTSNPVIFALKYNRTRV